MDGNDSLVDAISLISKYSPDQARDDHGRWEGGGLSSAIREATAWVSGKSAGEIIAAGLDYAQNQKLALRLTQAAVNTLVGFVGQMDQGAMQTDMVNHEVEHIANNLRVSTARAKEMIRGAVVRLQEGRRKQLMKVETDPILRALQAVLDMLDRKPLDFSKAIADQFNFDRFDPATQAMLRDEQDRLIRELEVTARDTINQIGQDAMRAGLGPEATVDQIRDVIGLTARQAQAVVNYRNMLESLDATVLSRALRDPQYDSTIEAAIESGESFSAAAVDEMVSAYESRYLDYRAKTIADTESVRMTNQGLQDSYRQAIDRGAMPAEAVRQYWLLDQDEKTCDVCLSIPDRNPQGVALGEAFDSIDGPQDCPPAHVSCRCELSLETDISMLPDEEPKQ